MDISDMDILGVMQRDDTFEMFRIGHFYGIEYGGNGQLLLTEKTVEL